MICGAAPLSARVSSEMGRPAGLAAPGETALVKTALAGIRRRKARRPKQQAPLTIEHLAGGRFRHDLKGRREKGLPLAGFAGRRRAPGPAPPVPPAPPRGRSW